MDNLGEWWNDDVDKVEKDMMKTGDGPKVSDAYTLNGLPGPLYPCSTKGPVFSLNRWFPNRIVFNPVQFGLFLTV